jgi:cobalt-zinc-cadmium efflux system outer membrane protein
MRLLSLRLAAVVLLPVGLHAQRAWTWTELRERFTRSNPSLRAAQIGIDEARAQEVTASLRPNPEVTSTMDQFDPFTPGPYRPLANTLPLVSASYLHERGHKRELRTESAQEGTAVVASQRDDLERTMLFNLRNAFVQALQAKAVLDVARENLSYYDRMLELGAERLKAGDIAQMDLNRMELQRVQFESDLRTAEVSLRTAKIQLLGLLNDRTPVDQFDVAGPFDFSEALMSLDELHRIALAARPDLRAAEQGIDKAKTDYRLAIANGLSDPTFSMDLGRNPPIPAYVGFSVNFPLRIFDRNQGEKARTQLDIQRTEQLRRAAEVQVFSDVNSAWETLNSDIGLLKPYKGKYLALAGQVRETVSFSYQHGGASLLDFLQAENEYRSVRLNYVNLVGAYLTAASQLNLAVGREVIP